MSNCSSGISSVALSWVHSFSCQVKNFAGEAEVVKCVMGEPVASEPRLFVGQVTTMVSYVAPVTLTSGMCPRAWLRGCPALSLQQSNV